MGDICSAYFKTKDGVRLHYLEAGAGGTLIILPGWTQPAASFQAQLEGLSGEFHCLALDFRAHGNSERPNYGYRLSRATEDLREFLDHCGVEDVTLLGHSAGCAVIWNFIDLFGEDRIHAHIFADQMIARIKMPCWSDAECRRYGATMTGGEAIAQAATLAGPNGEEMLRQFLSSEFTPNFPRAEIEKIIERSLAVPRDYAAKLMLSISYSDYRDVLPRIRRPTLCITGAASPLGAEAMPWIASQIPNARLSIIGAGEGGSHFMYLENPEAFNAEVRNFLTEVY
jgi:non-heme chloroperoxidase